MNQTVKIPEVQEVQLQLKKALEVQLQEVAVQEVIAQVEVVGQEVVGQLEEVDLVAL